MEETRVRKYKAYRDSIIKEDAIKLEDSNNGAYTRNYSDPNNVTSALPIDQVMGKTKEVDEEKAFVKKEKTKKILKIGLIVLGALMVVAVFVIVGLFLWRN